MKILLVTEKYNPDNNQRDGGARLVDTLKNAFDGCLQIMQFGLQVDSSAEWNFNYPISSTNRFKRRIANAEFIAWQVKAVEEHFTHVIFIHISMQFGLVDLPLRKEICIWTFPMFLTPSYQRSGEIIPAEYTAIERIALVNSLNILTPSHLEKKQLIEFYSIPEKQIHVVPRGIDISLLAPKVRSLKDSPSFCSIGSIKPQKNTLGLVDLFAKLIIKFPGSTLRIIGPNQDNEYYTMVLAKIQLLRLTNSIELMGHVIPADLAHAIKNCHIHISTSLCETFGRSIFETLASGLPNIARLKDNASAEYLSHLPYTKFVKDDNEALSAIEEVLSNLPKLSSMAIEIGRLYDDAMLSRLLAAKICSRKVIVISDFDGTLFYKNDVEKTTRCMRVFQQFQTKVICSARSINDLLENIKFYNLEVDWIIGYSGAMVTDGKGKLLWFNPLNINDIDRLKDLVPQFKVIKFEEEIIQIALPIESLPNITGLNIETYQNTAFISNWEASKFRAIHRLLRHINWTGSVKAFGDGLYDKEFLTYFDGELIIPSDQVNIKMTHLKKNQEILSSEII